MWVEGVQRKASVAVDCFDGDHGEPVITHKNTLIQPITLRNTLQSIKVRLEVAGPAWIAEVCLRDEPLPRDPDPGEPHEHSPAEGDGRTVGRDPGGHAVQADEGERQAPAAQSEPAEEEDRHPGVSEATAHLYGILYSKKIFTSDEVDDYEEHDSPILEKVPYPPLPLPHGSAPGTPQHPPGAVAVGRHCPSLRQNWN